MQGLMVIEAARPACVGLFAAGRGGDPARHLPLLQTLAERGCTIVAPVLGMLVSSVPTKADLDERLERLDETLAPYVRADMPLVGVGHSLGAVSLLAMAGGAPSTLGGEQAASGSWTFQRLALLAPAADFFRRPGSLDAVTAKVGIWAGEKDLVTPPAQALFLASALPSPADVQLDPDAGHFTFMDMPPPQAAETHPDRRAFLAGLADEVARFVLESA